MRWASGVMALLFGLAVVVQYNDPDPALWMCLYGAAALLSGAVALGRRPLRSAIVVFAGLAGGAIYLLPALRWVRRESFTVASAGSLADEEARETLGLILVTVWTGALLGWLWRRVPRPDLRRVGAAALAVAALVPLALHAERRSREPSVVLDRLTSPAVLVPSGSELVTTVFEKKNNLRTLLRVPMAGGAPVRLASAAMGVPSVALDAERVYWTSYLEGTVSAVPLRGGKVELLVSELVRPFGIGVDPASVYFSTRRAGRRALMKVAKTGGPSTLLVEDQRGVHSLRVDGGSVFWTTEDGVAKVSTSGGGVRVLARERSRPTAIDVSAGYVYYAVAGGIERVPANGGAVEPLTRIASRVVVLVVDQDTVYAATGGPQGAVLHIPARGGAVVPMGPLPAGASGLALGAEKVFVTTEGTSGQLLALPR
jgi:hypothetical protein